MRNSLACLLVKICTSLILFLQPAVAQEQPFRVLVLHSYDAAYHWTRDLQSGIDASVENADKEVKLSVEFMDSKRNLTPRYITSFKQYFYDKYKHYQFDGIIITDDNAANIFPDLYPEGVGDIPIVAVGINNKKLNLNAMSSHVTVFYSLDNIAQNLTLIDSVIPKLQQLYFFNDLTTSGKLLSEQVKVEHTNSALSHVPLTEVTDLTLNQATKLAQSLTADDAILLGHFNTELNAGIYHTYNQISKMLGRQSNAPIFVLWNFYVQNGVLGGYVNHSKRLGELAVETLDQQLDLGLTDVGNSNTSYRPVVDFNALKRHQINPNLLPANALVVNKPITIWQEYQRAIYTVIAAFAVLIVVILVQGVLIRNKQIIARHTKKILALKNRTLNVQKEMILMLGDAIETRSGETGSHVKRVAKMSARLGKLCGLSHREVEMLEIVSPMHDVGKIAISEAILEKPGKLEADEWAIMQTHTTIGYKMLNKSKGELFTLAAFVAHEHHEKWNGSGYPRGISGESIHIFARITALADVFDALLSKRCYKEPWPIEKVIALLKEESGKQFDPQITALMLDNIDDFLAIRERYPDSVYLNVNPRQSENQTSMELT